METTKLKTEQELLSEIRNELELIGEQYESYWLDSIDDYAYLLEPSEVGATEYIRSFRNEIEIEPFKVKGNEIDDSIDVIGWMKKLKYSEDEIEALLFKHCSIEYSTSYYAITDSLYSYNIGEMEEQIDFEYHDELRGLIEQLTPETRAREGFDGGSTYIYTEPCKFIAAVLDVDAFLNDFKKRLRSFLRENDKPATVHQISEVKRRPRAPEYNIALKRRELFRPEFNNVVRVNFGGRDDV
jgi:hypothetical protein